MWKTWFRSLGWEDPLEKGRLPTPVFWPGESRGLQVMGSKSWTRLSDFHFHFESTMIQRTADSSGKDINLRGRNDPRPRAPPHPHREAGGAPCHQSTFGARPGAGGCVHTREEAVHDPSPHGPTLRGRGVMSRAKRVKDAGNAGAPGNLPGAEARRPEFLSSPRLKMGCPQHGRKEKGSAGGWAGTGGRPQGNRKLNCQPGLEISRSGLSMRTGRGWGRPSRAGQQGYHAPG